MSALAHPSPLALPVRRRRHLTLVASPELQRESLADVIALPTQKEASAQERLRLTTRGRVVLATLAVAAAAVLGSVLGSVANAAAELPTDVEVVTVGSGDTLWDIASNIAAPGEDVRDVMAQIVALNNLQAPELAAGQVLTVPSGD